MFEFDADDDMDAEELAEFYRKLLSAGIIDRLTEREIAHCRMRLEELTA